MIITKTIFSNRHQRGGGTYAFVDERPRGGEVAAQGACPFFRLCSLAVTTSPLVEGQSSTSPPSITTSLGWRKSQFLGTT